MKVSEALEGALNLPGGARFFRCALQVNPFGYLRRFGKETRFTSETEYNKAIINACRENCIEVIGVTDHYHAEGSKKLVRSAREAGLFAFLGFEAVASDGVHYLCLFDPERDQDIEKFIGRCGIQNDSEKSPIGTEDSLTLLRLAREEWSAACISAHVASNGGLLKKLSGQTRIQIWRSENLLACALPGPVGEAPDNLRPILENRDPQHRRARPIAIINAQDVNDPQDLSMPGSSCFIKMSNISTEALRQAFLDPTSRIRLNSMGPPEPHTEFLAMAWEGGFLDGTRLHFNENLNVLIGGRGTGKSTVIESLRYVLDLEPLGEDADVAHKGIVRYVLGGGTKISLMVRSHHPAKRNYVIERTVPNPAVVKDESGRLLSLLPRDIVPGVGVFGQHEISELTKSHEKLTLLLERFVEQDAAVASRKATMRLELGRSRGQILEIQKAVKAVEDQLAALPALEETLACFQEAGLEEQLKEKSQLVREEQVLVTMRNRVSPLVTVRDELKELIPIDTVFLSGKSLDNLPNAGLLAEGREIFDRLDQGLRSVIRETDGVLEATASELDTLHERWDKQRKTTDENYNKLLRKLQKSNIDGVEFIQLRQQIERLRPLQEQLKKLKQDLQAHEDSRRKRLPEWEDLLSAEYRALARAARSISRKLQGRVQVKVNMAGNIEPLESLLRNEVGGQLGPALERLKSHQELSLRDLAESCREVRSH